MTVPVRLARRLAELVHCSRREAELYIAGGWVSVDGQVVEEPQFMVSQQKVELHPDATLVPVESVTILFHQPSPQPSDGTTSHSTRPPKNGDQVAGYPSGRGSDREGQSLILADSIRQLPSADTRAADDRSGIRLLKQHFVRLTQCLPLQLHASGLTVFTQDYRVIRKLTEDAATIEQEYVVEVAGELVPDGFKLLNHGLSFNGKPLPPVKVSWQNETHLRFALKGAQPGQVAHMCLAVGLQVQAMKRLRIGRMSMCKLPLGQWRYLMPYEKF
ncbi:rRNA pseudouridine synthase [Sideroxydans lithotrophicus]|uniref:Dual-specificity RNA pseudouridine synthase RluF n=1 Tax=Sideroxydans lithotrophicus (strain ES-1) TaxID=580332 RepID=D5CPQ4_SIDLE|nr:rRNA pseudouridine synthase [Sideroxydans lithotrophicus]ADE13049.1 RNA-binding S4 domain protein [Sideroxydans lithotrophicus ES-1]